MPYLTSLKNKFLKQTRSSTRARVLPDACNYLSTLHHWPALGGSANCFTTQQPTHTPSKCRAVGSMVEAYNGAVVCTDGAVLARAHSRSIDRGRPTRVVTQHICVNCPVDVVEWWLGPPPQLAPAQGHKTRIGASLPRRSRAESRWCAYARQALARTSASAWVNRWFL